MVLATSKKHVVDAFQAGIYKVSNAVEREGDVSTSLHQTTLADKKRRKFETSISRWINEYTASEHLIVRDFVYDLATGEILIYLLGKLTGKEIQHKELARSAISHQENLASMLTFLEGYISVRRDVYTPISIQQCNHSAVYSLMYDIAHRFECPYDLPSDFVVREIRREMIRGGNIVQKTQSCVITRDESDVHALNMARRAGKNFPVHLKLDEGDESDDDLLSDTEDSQDAFDSLFSADPEKVEHVRALMRQFVNTHVSLLCAPVEDLTEDLHDGVCFLWLLGTLGNFFIPISDYVMKPETDMEKLQNVKYALRLMEHMGVSRKGIRSQKIVEKDPKCIFRMTYAIFAYSRKK
eukprot:CFRG4328T1